MIFTNDLNETLQVCNLDQTNADIVSNVQKTDMTFIWNTGQSMKIEVDKYVYILQKNQIIFLTEFHKIDSLEIESARMVRFNQPFYCIVNHDNEVGSKGMLFFGASDIPIVTVDDDMIRDFELSWEIFCSEINKNDILKQDMLQSLLKRMLILSVRILRQSNKFSNLEKSQSDVIREFNYLVERHFAEHHDVAFYASRLNKSPKTLSNLFSLVSSRAPLHIIHDRIMIHAKRQINYSGLSIKEIAYELGYDNIQTFSRFFKSKEGVSPVHYRKKVTESVY
ncbi:helix-turn-helix domain-containing protein [Chryseobacterium sp. PTM-20240506]|uniref:AraC family transcriptional regulator n=1 Tax=unclassified Chryseobacterium TaxID=2593645 RepID=UPI0023590EA8|nr:MULTISPECIES: helix-turn-helix domain-containing protein [unclassified Chryseobacterium]MDC8103403.1 helix-turn-helix domain-containing protein [Chryseobacterium sp. B21-037]MDQ1802960.1 helix-turn-helix domain-containing protein [Chryseobacterium sp. CKR4-1]